MTVAEIASFLVGYFCLLFSISVHESAHAAMADRCGDSTARWLGRITLNPLRHIDPIGTVLMPLLMRFTGIPFLFGWAKPVPFNPRNLRNIQRDPVLIALAGPASNLLIAFLFVFIARFSGVLVNVGLIPGLPTLVELLLLNMIAINMVLAVFNLLPVPPLDGHHVLYYFLPDGGQRVLDMIGPYGILIAVVVFSPILNTLFSPVLNAILLFAGF